jgi:hypothetical protein
MFGRRKITLETRGEIMDRTITRERAFAAMAQMEKDGWEKRLSVLQDRGHENGEYGILYAKGDRRFWLNNKTIDNLPGE